MRHLLTLALLAAFALPAFAVGPQDVTLEFTTRAGGGPVEGHVLYINGARIGEVRSGEAISGAIPGNGPYVACVSGYNVNRTVNPPVTQETAGGNCLTATLGDLPPDPPAPTDVTLLRFGCQGEDGEDGTCAVIFSPAP